MKKIQPSIPEGYVYVIGSDANSLVKIGWSKDVDRRCRDLEAGSPIELEILRSYSADPEMEHWLHDRFEIQRKHGEWFALRKQLGKIDAAVREYQLQQMAPDDAEACRRAERNYVRLQARRNAVLTSA
jgi:hypothetical protein